MSPGEVAYGGYRAGLVASLEGTGTHPLLPEWDQLDPHTRVAYEAAARAVEMTCHGVEGADAVAAVAGPGGG